MKLHRRLLLVILAVALLTCPALRGEPPAPDRWPPIMPTANADGTATLVGPELLRVPDSVQKALDTDLKAAKFVVAKNPPTVDVAYHAPLPDAALNGTGWSAWGGICLATDGKVYAGIGNHGGINHGECFLFCWDPQTRALKRVVDVNKILAVTPTDLHWSKTHASPWEGNDKKIYFTCTLDDGGRANNDPVIKARWNAKIPGGQIFQYDPVTGATTIYAAFPGHHDTATVLFDRERNIMYCCLEGDLEGVALGAFDMGKKEWIYQSPFGLVHLDRTIMLDRKGNVYFNGPEDQARWTARVNVGDQSDDVKDPLQSHDAAAKKPGTTLWKYDPQTRSVSITRSSFDDAGIRSATRESKNGWVYGTTMGGDLYRYNPRKDQLVLMGKDFLEGEYITTCDLSPDERYMYYLPGAHGSAGKSGTPVIQYDIEKQQQKAIAFLFDPMAKAYNYEPGGTYGIRISADGSTLFANLNGCLPKAIRSKGNEDGFGLTSFTAVYIPAGERGGK